MARYVCKNIVSAKLAKRCEIEIAYAIGRARPVSVTINSFGTGVVSDEKLMKIVEKVFDFRPLSIIKNLDLRKPIYQNSSNYGHLGREEFSWEKTDKVEALIKAKEEL